MMRIVLIALLLLPSVASGQGLLDWMGQPAKVATATGAMDNSDLYSLRPDGKYAYIVAVSSEKSFGAWSNRAEVESKGWGVVRIEPKVERATSFVIVGDRITALRNLPTNADLIRVVEKLNAKPAIEITMFTRSPCKYCDAWMETEYPKAIAAGAIVKVLPEPNNTQDVPHFRVCRADGYCREITGFTTFESMIR